MKDLELENAKRLVQRLVKSISEDGLSTDIYFENDIDDKQYKADYMLTSYQHFFIGDVYHVMVNTADVKIYVFPIVYFHTSEYGIPSEYARWEAHDVGEEESNYTQNTMTITQDGLSFEFSSEEDKFQQRCTDDGFYIDAIESLFNEINKYFPEIWDKPSTV